MAVGSKSRPKKARPRILNLLVAYTEAEEGGYDVEILGSDGGVTQGETIEEARANALDVIAILLEESPGQLSTSEQEIPPGALVERVVVMLPRAPRK